MVPVDVHYLKSKLWNAVIVFFGRKVDLNKKPGDKNKKCI